MRPETLDNIGKRLEEFDKYLFIANQCKLKIFLTERTVMRLKQECNTFGDIKSILARQGLFEIEIISHKQEEKATAFNPEFKVTYEVLINPKP